MRRLLPAVIALAIVAGFASAETVVASRNIRAGTLLQREDLVLVPDPVSGAISSLEQAIGQEARIAIYAGRSIRQADLGAPTVVERNQIIMLAFTRGALRIETEGRALERASAGDVIRVMNASSKSIVTARIAANGTGLVRPQ